MENIVSIILMWYLGAKNCIAKHQSGIRHCKSATDHVVQLENYNRQKFVKSKHGIVVFFDSGVAYDTAWKHNLFRKLHQFELRENLIQLSKIL